MFKDQFEGSAFYLVNVRSFVLCLLILSVLLPYVRITYYGEQIYEDLWWYTGLSYSLRRSAVTQYSASWTVQWFAIPMFAFPFVLMFFGLKKRYTFDVGVSVFALFFSLIILPPLISPQSMGEGWNLIESEALIGSYVAAISLIAYGVARLLLQGATASLEKDRIPPIEDVEQPEVVKRKLIWFLALLSFVLPFAVEYKIHHFPEHETAELTTVYYWFGNVWNYPSLFSILLLPIVYLPLIIMWLGIKRTKLFNQGVILFAIYWVWHLLLFLKPLYVVEAGWSEQITAPTLGIVFFPTILIIYISSIFFKRQNYLKLQRSTNGKRNSFRKAKVKNHPTSFR